MPSHPGKLDQLFDRTWRPGHPFRPRLSSFRRRAAIFFLVLLVGVITAYAYLTNSRRVRQMCETYLSKQFGATVTVKHAALSIFEGLRLDGVSVSIPGDKSPDARLFDAQSFMLKYNLRSLFCGDLQVTEILAIDPRVNLCERLDDTSGPRWNYGRMIFNPSARPPSGVNPEVWPIITLRNGIIQYSQMQGGQQQILGSMALDGSVTPSIDPADAPGEFISFRFQSRGQESQTLGPEISGKRNLETGEIKNVRLENFRFSKDLKAMLPEPVRKWWDVHQLAGGVSITDMDLVPAPDASATRFRVEANLTNVEMTFEPSEWWSRQEIDRLNILHHAFDLMRGAGLDSPIADAGLRVPEDAPAPAAAAPGIVQWIAGLAEPSSVRLSQMAGQLVFTQEGIQFNNVEGRIEHNSFNIDGHIDGYSPSVPADITVRGTEIDIPHTPRYVNSLPRAVHEFWQHLHPEGACSVFVHLSRTAPGARPDVDGRIDILDGRFEFDLFRYPLRKVTGTVTFGPDPQNPGTQRCDIKGLRGLGVPGGPNAANVITLDGYVAPLNPDGRVHLDLSAPSVYLEKALNDAFAPDVKTAMRMFDAGGTRGFPEGHGKLQVVVERAPGPEMPVIFSVFVDIDDGSGSFSLFPYPLQHVQAKISILPGGRLEIANARVQNGPTKLVIDGVVLFGDNRPLDPHLKLTAQNLPIDKQLLDAIPPQKRQWLEKLGLSGTLDIAGNIFRAAPPAHAVKDAKSDDTIDFDLQMALRDAAITPPDSKFSLTAISSQLRLSAQRIVFSKFQARRGPTQLSADGSMEWPDNQPVLQITAAATNLALDAPLHDLLPAPARNFWDQLQPTGAVDAEITYRGASPTGPPTTPGQSGTPRRPGSPPDAPAAPAFLLKLKPRQLSTNFKFLPYPLSDMQGSAIIEPSKVTLSDFSARHGDAAVSFSGTGALDAPAGAQNWNLHVTGKGVVLDDAFKKSMPPALGKLLESLQATGTITFDFPHFSFAAGTAPPAANAPPAATTPAASGTDMDISGELHLHNGSLSVGVPLGAIDGAMGLGARIRGSKLAEFKGNVKIDSMTIADRPAKNFVATLEKPADRDALKVDRMGGAFAGGEMSGQVDVSFPDIGKSRFALAFVLRSVDVKELARVSDPVKGQLNASLSLEGAWDDPASRRGRGDVDLSGKDMYKIPLVLGLMQITNLSLPLTSPFSQATAKYSVDGPRVTFETINLRSGNMVMSGSGSMNFESRKVKMTFTTDNPDWPQLPLVGGLIQGAKNELLQIHVNGTIQEPKVSAGTMNTFTTTVDQVFRSGEGADSDNSDAHRH